MNSTVDPGDTMQIKALVIQDMISTSILVNSATVFFYYCVTHLDKEVEYIWSRKWNAGKVMYLLTRYSGALFLGITVVYTVGFRQSSQAIISEELSGVVPPSTIYFASVINVIFILIVPIAMTLTEIILQMRVYAIYGRKKWIIVISVIMNLASAAVCALQAFEFSYILSEVACYNNKFACSSNLPLRPITNPNTVIIFEALTQEPMAALAKYVCLRRVKNYSKSLDKTHDIMTIVARDSTSYFAIVFTVAVIGLVIFLVAETARRHSLLEEIDNGYGYLYRLLSAYEAITITITTILAPRMLINIRLEVYHQKRPNESTIHNASTFYAVSATSFVLLFRLEFAAVDMTKNLFCSLHPVSGYIIITLPIIKPLGRSSSIVLVFFFLLSKCFRLCTIWLDSIRDRWLTQSKTANFVAFLIVYHKSLPNIDFEG
ncbi:hypothetical protein PNOK_0876800 [Pyrrhoderma noxium]|uniref:DUF6533 domain-containing protein n=1 Tax=Pyrrhoderma noxium TaxID=2282107 RepID=A0A286U8L6_9AGAM|nr:hypothetical protein PNOK_0876800 [Pyrrhoderma noxium]